MFNLSVFLFVHLSSPSSWQLRDGGWDPADVAYGASPSPSATLGPIGQALSEWMANAVSWGEGLIGARDDATTHGRGAGLGSGGPGF